jgi:phospholipase/lecithinase/hemolysin
MKLFTSIPIRATLLAANISVLALAAQPAAARVWVFGDSNVDSGWYKVSPFSGSQKFDFDLAMAFTFDIGKPTNNPGPMSVEVLAFLLRTTAHPANQGGTNYATSGAKNVNVNTPLNGDFPHAVPTATQISNFLSDDHHQRSAVNRDLFLIDSGANDIKFALSSLSGFTSAQQAAYIEAQAVALAQAIKDLQHRGARHLIVVGQQESFSTAQAQAARQLYDTTLRSTLDAEQVHYAWGDKNQVRKDIMANPATFKIQFFTTATNETACPLPNPVLNITTAWALLCSAKSPVTQPTAFADQALFADDQHFAAGAQKILGSYYHCLARFTWPHLASFEFPRPPFACDDFSEFKDRKAPELAAE